MDNLVGFNNLGNTCYLNSAMQIIVNCTVLTKVILSQSFKSEALNTYKKFLIEYKNAKQGSAISPIEIKNLVGAKDKKFLNFQQHDSHEFLITLMELLEDELKKEYKESKTDILGIKLEDLMSNIFDTTVSSIIYSEETDEKSKTRIGEKILSLPIPNSRNITLDDCLDLYTKIEKLTGDCQWQSEKENRKVDAYKRLYLKSLPKYLLIQLKRFTFFSASNKNNNDVIVPTELNIKNHKYELRGIIFHMGGAGGGHYISIIKMKDKWFACNDNSVSEVSNINNFLNKGYTYLFVKQK
jgi:ubiquitin C-terminal hydrolase